MEKLPRPLWKLLLQTNNTEKVDQLTCEECFALLEYDAGLLAAGASFNAISPSVNHHLVHCSRCQAEFDDWLEKLEGDSRS